MMKNSIRCVMEKTLSAIIATVVLISTVKINAGFTYANDNQDKVVVVSLGDSYSSGEGIEPFYGQEKSLKEKVKDENWLAHRSTKSWPSLLEISGIDGKMKDYWSEDTNSSVCEWYFAAVSGAETKHFKDKQQKKTYKKKTGLFSSLEGTVYLPKQLDVFDQIEDSVDYVTLTVGGNDVDFAGIITECATGSTYLEKVPLVKSKLQSKINNLWDNFDEIESNIKQTYIDISEAAGSQANIIVAGYPKLLDKKGKGFVISEEEATIVNDNVSRFNDKLENIVDELRRTGIKIYFVDVEQEFDKDGGHQAYSKDSWINKIILGTKSEDLKSINASSAYSVHPNADGAKAYARCVNATIEEIENKGQLSGKICTASDRVSPVKGATVQIYKDNLLYDSTISDDEGNYNISVPAGNYFIYIIAPGYISFSSYATVQEGTNTYMETFLMVTGGRYEQGIATGTIKNALTGRVEEGVKLSVRQGWNNLEYGDVISTTLTDENGDYSIRLPLGNYTLVAEKMGYVTTPINIIVQSGTTNSQNGTIMPVLSGDNFSIVLTWGRNPSDLDSHIQGELSNGNAFHVYFGLKNAYDNDINICKLDVDDTSSYGPETITLKTSSDKAYYYYIHHYSGSGTFSTSEARVNLYQSGELIAVFNVPTNQGLDRYWNVFAIDNGKLVIKNTITNTPDITYCTD